VLNARDAAARGARVLTRCTVVSARRSGGLWQVALRHADGADETVAARALVNAAGPWVAEVAGARLGQNAGPRIRLVRGSHIVTRRLYDHDRCYFLQGPDGRIVFLIPYERDFTLIGTTDRDHDGPPEAAACSDDEADYLLAFANRYLARPVGREAIVWRYSGVRPLIDEGAASASAATRDYRVTLDAEGAPLLTVHGGKITTYRRLAEAALARLAPALGVTAGPWTAGVPLPGGDFPVAGFDALVAGLRADYPFLAPDHARRLARAYGTEARTILGAARAPDELGEDFGATLTGAELRWLAAREYARTAEDVLWRRSKLGLRLSPAQAARVEAALAEIVRGG
jgi:glycerol-3-phosphate dehydrogenase